MKKLIILATMLALLAPAMAAYAWPARVVAVTDGDTITVESVITPSTGALGARGEVFTPSDNKAGGEDDSAPLRASNAFLGERVKIRLYGVDCPERNQPYGEAATAFVLERVLYQQVAVVEFYQDRYNRTVAAVVKMPDGHSLQELLVIHGLAWVDGRYCKDCKTLKRLQAEARAKGVGLWAGDNPIAPWEWRRMERGQ